MNLIISIITNQIDKMCLKLFQDSLFNNNKEHSHTYNPQEESIVPKGQRIYDPSVFGRYDLKSQRIIPIDQKPSALADLDILLERTQRLDKPPYFTERDRYSVLLKEIPVGDGICLDACTNVPSNTVKDLIETNGYTYTPIDFYPGKGVYQVDLTHLPYINNSIDLIISSDTLEHIRNYDEAISEIFRVLKPHRLAIIHVPCYYFEKRTNEPIENNVDPWGHIWYFSARSLLETISKVGFIVMRVTYIFDYGALLCIIQKPD